ncbi:hypothetical protein GCM10009753_72190 [Streptantibioticus ferralitis]
MWVAEAHVIEGLLMPACAISSQGDPIDIPAGYSVKVSAGSKLKEAAKGA